MTFHSFKKRFILPIIWWLKRKEMKKWMLKPSQDEILDVIKRYEMELRKHQRENELDAANETKGKIAILNWLIYG